MPVRSVRRSVLPGFKLTMGFTLAYLAIIVLIPLAGLPVRAASMGWSVFWTAVTDPRVVASYRLTLTTAFFAACINAVFGLLAAWVLVRYPFPGRRIVGNRSGNRTSSGTDRPTPARARARTDHGDAGGGVARRP